MSKEYLPENDIELYKFGVRLMEDLKKHDMKTRVKAVYNFIKCIRNFSDPETQKEMDADIRLAAFKD